MYKYMILMKKKKSISRAQFMDYYENSHVPLMRSLVSGRELYRRNYIVADDPMFNVDGRQGSTEDFGFDVITECAFAAREGGRGELHRARLGADVRRRSAAVTDTLTEMADPASLPPVPELKHHHAALSVPDLDESIAWYRDVLGFSEEERFSLPHVPATVALLRRGPLRIELLEVAGAAPLPLERRDPTSDLRTHGNKHVCFAVRDAEAAQDALKERGADIVLFQRAPERAFLFIRDNAGNLIEFYEEAALWERP